MSKTFVFTSILIASFLAAAVPSQAREFMVWGNNFTTDDGIPAQPNVAPLGRFNATVEHPERYRRGTHRIPNPVR